MVCWKGIILNVTVVFALPLATAAAVDAADENSSKKPDPPLADAQKAPAANSAGDSPHVAQFETKDGQRFLIDTTKATGLTDWSREELAPVVKEWYPKIVDLLVSEGFKAPDTFNIVISTEIGGVAATSGTDIKCNANWLRRNLKTEAKGAVVHELVHVVQQYARTRLEKKGDRPPPRWLVEGIADYIRWYLYEPESHGADVKWHQLPFVRYDGSYRVSANFLNWVSEKHGREVVVKLNAAAREGRYRDELWTDLTGQTIKELSNEWMAHLRQTVAPPEKAKTKTETEKTKTEP
jgi:hypothetical protein